MSGYSNDLSYAQLEEKLAPLQLPSDIAHLHGTLCGCLVAGGQMQAENYLRSLLVNKIGPEYRESQNALFGLFSMTQTWFSHFGFDFRLMLPGDEEDLEARVRAFVDWCQGFLDGFEMTGLEADDIESEEVLEVLQHFDEFSQMEVDEFDYESEEDEKAFIEISEYARLAVLQVLCDLQAEGNESQAPLHH
jgi:uncharacterized protein YgfB (UPF0149 family)